MTKYTTPSFHADSGTFAKCRIGPRKTTEISVRIADKTSVAEKNVILSCPLIESVDVVRHIPSSVTLKVVEVSPVYYCDLYGEKYGLTNIDIPKEYEDEIKKGMR